VGFDNVMRLQHGQCQRHCGGHLTIGYLGMRQGTDPDHAGSESDSEMLEIIAEVDADRVRRIARLAEQL
jgi:hypothetical protein